MSHFRKTFSILQFFALGIISVIAPAQSASEMKEIFAQAESYYLYGEYDLANQLYILLDSTNNQNIQYKIGVCYLNIPGEKEKAVPYLEKAIRNASYEAKEARFNEKRAPLDAYFYLAKAYMINNELDKGLATLQNFNRLTGETKSKKKMQNLDFINQQIQACNNALTFSDNPVSFSKHSLGPDFSQGSMNENPAVSYDGNTIVYTERRGLVNAIYFSKRIRGVWQPPVEITSDLNAGEDCSSCSLNNDGTELFLYKTDDFDGALYSSTYVNDTWTPIKKLNKNINTRFYESHASISPDGKTLYFTSNRDGGFGGLDIYVSERDAAGEWGPAKNLGPVINTPFNEDTPFVTSNDSLLYFSSEGHNSMGGFDIYQSARVTSGWSVPSNVGYPVNTTDDDKFLQPANNGMNAFYSITTGYKQKDIFYIDFSQSADAVIDPDTPLTESITAEIPYEKIDLSNIPEVDTVDMSLLIKDTNIKDVTEDAAGEFLYYTVQVIALHNPVDVSFFKRISDIKIHYNESDRFYRYTTGEFQTREDAYKMRDDLIRIGYPEDIFIKKVSRDTPR